MVYEYPHGYNALEELASSFPEFLNDVLLRDSIGWFGEDHQPSFSPAFQDKARAKKKTPKASANAAARSTQATPKAAKPKKRSAKMEREYLLKILADPGDEVPLLAYAEWLTQYKDPQGELIRLRWELPRLKGRDPRREELLTREQELLDANGKEWAESLIRAGTFISVLKRLGARVELNEQGQIRALGLEGALVTARVLAHLRGFPTLKSLDIPGHPLTPDEVQALAGLKQLEELYLKLHRPRRRHARAAGSAPRSSHASVG